MTLGVAPGINLDVSARVSEDDDDLLNRQDAGQRLAALLLHHVGREAIVLGLLRGGVIVASEVARALRAPLDVWVVRKIGAPLQPELAIGAIAEGGGAYFDESLARLLEISDAEVAAVVEREQAELERRIDLYRGSRPPPPIAGRTVILVDDGLATGSTARAALQALRAQSPARLVFAAPVAAADSLARLSELADEIVCLQPVTDLRAIGEWYADFAQTSDEQVMDLLDSAKAPSPSVEAASPLDERVVAIEAAGVTLRGRPRDPGGRDGARGLRPRQRQHPQEPAQSSGRRGSCARTGSGRCCSICSRRAKRPRT